MSIKKIGTLAAIGFLSLPAVAIASSFAVATHNVNVRAGPDIGYPVVDVARAGDEVYVYGCLERRAWCDVDFDGLRGWISSNYLAFYDDGYRYVGPQAMYRMRAPVITFSFDTYWDRHYRGRSFYRDRSRWEHFYRGHPRRWEGRDDRPRFERRERWERDDGRSRNVERRDRRRGSSRDTTAEELLRGMQGRTGNRWDVEQQ